MKRLRLLGLLVALAVSLGACGVPTQSSANRLSTKLQLPPAPATTVPLIGPGRQFSVYFLVDDRLYPVTESYGSDATDPYGAVLFALGLGPSAAQAACAITSYAPSNLSIVGGTHGTVVTVDLQASFLDVGGVELELGEAQIVYTLTGIAGGPNAVQFVSDGHLVPAFVPPGQLDDNPVGRSDYLGLAPSPTVKATCSKSKATTTTSTTPSSPSGTSSTSADR